MPELIASVFNDVIGPIMRGPSSSHSAASVRIGRLIHDLFDGVPDRVDISYDTLGSLATTHESQGTDMGLYGGLMGWEADDPRLPGSPEELVSRGTAITITKSELGDEHPNTYRLDVGRGDEKHQIVALSTGGGIIEVVEIDGNEVRLFGDYVTTVIFTNGSADAEKIVELEMADSWSTSGDLILALSQKPLDAAALAAADGVASVRTLRAVLPVLSRPELVVPFNHSSEMRGDLDHAPLSEWALAYECARGGIEVEQALSQAHRLLGIMRTGVETGIAGTEYADRILGWQSGNFATMTQAGSLLDGGILNQMIIYVTALMEAKSAMEVIVAAPTAGACATFPGALLATIDAVEADDEAAARALLAGGLIGVFVTNRSSFAAEVGGCQAETGAGAAMAAAALVELGGGSASRSLSAASQAIQNVLGLICDPVGNRVEAPCLGRNVSGAANALSCANMALAGYDHVVPFDEVLDAHRSVSELMARELRCTGLGGLAITPTAQKIELDLKRHRK